MKNEYYVVTTVYCFDRIVNKKEYVFRNRANAEKFRVQKEQEYKGNYEMSVKPIEVRYFED